MVHDLVLSVVFLSMVVAPALIAMRADSSEQDFLGSETPVCSAPRPV